MYTPSTTTLDKYADVLICFALNSGKGIAKNDVVLLVTPVEGMPLAMAVYAKILDRGGHPIIHLLDDDFKLAHLQHGSDAQIGFFADKYYRGMVDQIDHWVRILADRDPLFLKDVAPRKIMLQNQSLRPFREWLDKKEDDGKFTWTLCLYGTEGLAAQAGMSLPKYWEQINRACFLDQPDPIKRWRTVFADITRIQKRLTALPIKELHVRAPKTDLRVVLGEKRQWLGGSGRNIPSFEIFTSPDWRGTEGIVSFDLPLYRYGNIIKGIQLTFRNGLIVKATATKNEKLLREMIGQKNANKIGEFSLTDSRHSRINKFMADSLYDENFGGTHGNMHLAVGRAYHDALAGDTSKMTQKQFEALGFNHSPEHTDIIAGTDRVVTATLRDGSTKVIYEGGEFRV